MFVMSNHFSNGGIRLREKETFQKCFGGKLVGSEKSGQMALYHIDKKGVIRLRGRNRTPD